jgi:hypothetical protein
MIEDKKLMSIGYEDTDKKIEIDIYGIRFEINKEYLEKKENNAYEENELDKILGNGAIEKLNKKRLSDGYDEMTISVEMEIYGFILNSYIKAVTEPLLNNINGAVDEQVNKIKNMENRYNNQNRQQRRNNARNNNYRRNKYRRY